MKKKIFLISSIVILAAIVAFGVLYLLNNKADKKSETICAVPAQAAMIIELNSPADFLGVLKQDVGIFPAIAGILNLNINNSLFHYADSLGVLVNPENPQKIIWSFHPEGVNPFAQLLVINIAEDIKKENFAKEINDKLSVTGKVAERVFKDVVLYEYKSNGNLGDIHYYIKNGLFVVSVSQKLLEKSVESLMEVKSILDTHDDFKNLYGTAGKNEIANVYVNMALFPASFTANISGESKESIEKLKQFSQWTELDLSFDEQKLSLNGFSQLNDSVPVFTGIIQSQEAVTLKCMQVLPDNTSYYFAMSFNDKEVFGQKFKEYKEVLGVEQTNIDRCSKIKEETGIDIYASFYSLVDNEACFAVTTPGSYELFENSYTIIGLKSQASAEIELSNLVETIKLNSELTDSDLKDNISIDENTSINVFVLPFEGLPELLFGHYFSHCSGKYVCCVNNFMIFANSKKSLFKIVYDVVLHKTLETSIDHNLFLDNFSEYSNLFVYFSMSNGYEIFKNLFADELKPKITENADLLGSFGNFGYQLNKSNEMIYNNLVIKQQKYTVEKPQTVWESRLDTTVAIKPALVVNHDNNSKEIIVQDYKNNLYLLSNSGREIWSVKLDGRIESDVYQIDIYRNGKLQYLFSTKNKIYLIDRLGNNVDKYPIELRSSATAPLSLFDYSKNKNYRIVIPCENNKVYMYDGEGDIVKGWEFEGTENLVSSKISHYNVNGDDYITFKDNYKAYFLNRKGESKIDFLTKFEFSVQNKIYYDHTYSKKRFVTTDKHGLIRFFYTNGDQDSLKIREFSQEHYFVLKDVDSDGSNDYVFLDGNRLEVYNRQKKLMMAYDFEEAPSSEPAFYSFPRNQIKIGVVCSTVSKIYLINNDGSLFEGFPLYGLTPFSIGYLSSDSNKFNLIVGGQENLLYNYEVNEN